jgi:hypothetical protein
MNMHSKTVQEAFEGLDSMIIRKTKGELRLGHCKIFTRMQYDDLNLACYAKYKGEVIGCSIDFPGKATPLEQVEFAEAVEKLAKESLEVHTVEQTSDMGKVVGANPT